jgi:predicted DNA-binding antitoxin AbrB/MazE fold protein
LTIEARYEGGSLKPSKPLALRPGERVGVIVVRLSDAKRWDLNRLANGTATKEDKSLSEAGLTECADALNAEDRR